MKFKILKGSELFNKLTELFDKGDKCRGAARKLAKNLGAKDHGTRSGGNNYFGGIDALKFEDEPDKKMWRRVGEKYQRFYFPTVRNKEALQKIKDLPVVTFDEINKAIGWPDGLQVGEGLTIYHGAGLARWKGYFLMEIGSGVKYKPVEGAVEILESEYEKLMEPIKRKAAA